MTNNHQEKNARVLEKRGAAVVLLEEDCTPQVLYDTVKTLLADHDRRKEMSKALRSMVVPDAAEKICDILQAL